MPVRRNQNLVIEIEGGEPRAVTLGWAGIGALLGDAVAAEERLGRGEIVLLGVVEERAHFALDLSPIETPLDTLQSPVLAASGPSKPRVCGLPICANWAAGSTGSEAGLLAHARAMLYWHARHRFCGIMRQSAPAARRPAYMRRCTDPRLQSRCISRAPTLP